MPTFNIPQSVVNWMATGERGLSSESIVEYLYGFPVLEGHWRRFAPPVPARPLRPAALPAAACGLP